jgi:glycosyltransferase involved in cell wall biosynthesis
LNNNMVNSQKSKGKRLLIITDALPPAFAPRMAFLLDTLSQKGYQVTAFSIAQTTGVCHLSTGSSTVHTFTYHSNNPVAKAGKLLLEATSQYKDHWFYKQIKPHIQGKHFDAVLCSSYETFPLPCALQIAQERNIPLIADLRDITEQFGTHYFANRHPHAPWLGKWFANIKINRRNRVLKQAQAVVSVSPWHVQFLQEKVLGLVSDTEPPIHLIYNGYDATKFQFKPISSDKFTLVYTGRLVDPVIQNPTLFWQALQALLTEKKLNKQHVQVAWYTDNASATRLQNMVQGYSQVSAITHYHSMVAAEQVPALLQESSMVLVLTNQQTAAGPKGIMTTKFFEALGVEKPVLCVRSDEACLSDAIQKTNAGVAAKNIEEVKAFILEKYTEWQQNGYTHQNVVIAEKEKFSRQEQAKAFEHIIQSIL